MKYYTFQRESNNFDDILNDTTIKKKIYVNISWKGYLMIGLDDHEDKLKSYVILKYGDELRNSLTKNYTPIPNIDYIPRRKE
jgi:hypothetical protein